MAPRYHRFSKLKLCRRHNVFGGDFPTTQENLFLGDLLNCKRIPQEQWNVLERISS
jgi:hypothetical protein